MIHLFRKFLQDDTGAVTVDWVVLAAGIVLMGAVLAVPIGNNVTDLSREMGTSVSSMGIATY